MCWCQILLVIGWCMQMVFMGCHKQIMCRRWCLYSWWVCSFYVHCGSGCIGRQLNTFTLERIISSTWKHNSAQLTKLVWWWDVENIYRDLGSIDCTVDVNIFNIWLGAVARGDNVIDVWWHMRRDWQDLFLNIGVWMWLIFGYRQTELDEQSIEDK